MRTALIILLALVVVVIAGTLLAGPQLRDALQSLTPKPQPTKVRLQTVEVGRLTETVKAPGRIEPKTKVDISAEIAARIEQLPFREGQTVRRGDVIVRLDDRDLKAALAAAKARRDSEEYRLRSDRARLAGSLSSLENAKRNLERNLALFNTGDLSKKELDDAQQLVDELQAQVDAAKYSISVIESLLASANAEIDRAEQTLAKTIIQAPMDGVITALNAEVGEVVLMGTMNNPGTVIMTIADLSRMILKAEVSESDIARVQEGQKARIHINAYRDQVFSGTVTEIALQRTDKPDGTGYFETEVEIDLRGQRILSGLMANVDIEIATHEGLVVESQAIVDRLVEDLPADVVRDNPLVDSRKRATTVVYQLLNGKAVCTPVRRGPSDDTHSIVEAGLDAGSMVVIGPFKVLESIKHNDLIIDERDVPASGGESDSSLAESNNQRSGVRIRVGR